LTLAVAGIAVFACGCLLVRSKRDLALLDQAVRISGSVVCPDESGKPICVTLYKDVPGEEHKPLIAYRVLYRSGDFLFYQKAGDYYLGAFEDANEDFTFQPDERVGWLGKPSPLHTVPGERYDGLQITLRPPEIARKQLPALHARPVPQAALNLESKHVGTQASLSDERFSDANALLGMWEPVKFLDDYGAGLFFLEPYSEAKTPVLFVHGVGGTPRSFAPLIASLDRDAFQPWVAHYPSGLRLAVLSDGFADILLEAQARFGFKRVIVVAHSMGGLLARSTINHLAAETHSFVPVFVTISTPWEGHPGAETGINRSPVILPCWYDMAPGSPFLADLRRTPLPPETRYHLFFGYRGDRPLFIDDNSDGTIPLSSLLDTGMQDEAVKVFGFDETHATILRSPTVAARLAQILAPYRAGR